MGISLRSLALILLLLTAGCAGAPEDRPAAFVLHWNAPEPQLPPEDDKPPSTVVVEWDAAKLDFDPRDMAERHCAAWDRHARPLRKEDHGATRVAVFACAA